MGFNELQKVFFVVVIFYLFVCLLKPEGISPTVFAVSPLKCRNSAYSKTNKQTRL